MLITNGELGLAESYMYGYWYSNDLYSTLYKLSSNYNNISYYDFNINDIFSIISKKYLIIKLLVDH